MNAKRRVELTCSLLRCGAAVALGALSPPVALATSCGPTPECVGYQTCLLWTNSQRISFCNSVAPPGRTQTGTPICLGAGQQGCTTGGIECFYR